MQDMGKGEFEINEAALFFLNKNNYPMAFKISNDKASFFKLVNCASFIQIWY
jgi:hypothetical protein